MEYARGQCRRFERGRQSLGPVLPAPVEWLFCGRELRDDPAALKTMVLQEKTKNASSAVKDPTNDLGISEGYYTEEQAARGKNYYYGACGMCHTAEPGGPNGVNMPHESGLGWHWGNQWRYTVQAGKRGLETNSRISGK